MYSMKPIIDPYEHMDISDLPTCMYRMKSIHDKKPAQAAAPLSSDVSSLKQSTAPTAATTSSSAAALNSALFQQITDLIKRSDTNDMAKFEIRQGKILEQLEALKERLLLAHAELGICAKPVAVKIEDITTVTKPAKPATKPSTIKQRPINKDYLQDIVVNANPENVPYSLIALKTLWQDRLNISIRACTHSSVIVLSDAAVTFNESLKRLATVADEVLPNLNILLIWKNVSQLEMVSAAPNFFAVSGEVNVLRYLSRIGPNEFSHDMVSLAECVEIDGTLDLCSQLWTATNDKERKTVLQDLLKRLDAQDYYGGKQLVLSDVAVSSSVMQLPKNMVPAPFGAWLARISKIVGY